MNILKKLSLRKSSQEDLFIKRIRSLVIGEGMLHEGNIPLMEHAIKNLPPEGRVLEIGSYGGLSTNLIAYLLKKHGKTNPFFNVDAWIYEGFRDHLGIAENHVDGRIDITRAQYSSYMKQSFIQATLFLSRENLPHSFHLHSHDFFEKWKNNTTETDLFQREVRLGGPIAFAYVDGGHSAEVALQDFLFVSEYLVNQGFILWDDTSFMTERSPELMKRISSDRRFKVIQKHPNLLLQKTN